MFLTKKHLSRRTVLKGAGVTLALPLLDAMVPAATALAQTAASPKLRMGFFYIPHGAIMGNTSFGPEMDRWTPSGRRRRLQAQPDPEVARALQAIRHLVRQPAEPGDGGRRAQPGAGHVAERHASPTRLRRREHVRDARSGRGAAHRPEHDAAVAGGRRRKRRSRRPRAAVRRASTTPRSRSATRTRRCRWSTTRARSSRSCSAKATRPKSAPPSPIRRRACSTASAIAPARCGRTWVPAIVPCSTTTWRPCARSSGAYSWRRAAISRRSRCPRRRSAS